MKIPIYILLFTFSIFGFIKLDNPKVKPGDLKPLLGTKWTGNLTYLDYSSNKKVSIKSNLTVTKSAESTSIWIFDFEYPEEPKANEKVEVEISKDGKMFDGEQVIEKIKLPNATLKIVTVKNGEDNNKLAIFRHTYLINKQSFSIKKEVQYEGSNEFFERNKYSWKR